MGKNKKGKQNNFPKRFRKFEGKNKNFNKKKFEGNNRQRDRSNSSKEHIPKKNLSEDKAGITEYISKLEGFRGVIKARFSDFHVNEIDLDGNLVKLTDQQVPEPISDVPGSEELASYKKELESIITKEIWTEIDAALADNNSDNKNLEVKINVTDQDKEKRTLVHKILKEHYGSKIVSSTITIDDKKFIHCRKSKGAGEFQRTKWLWPGEYVYFVVHKENADTVQAASDIAQFLRLQPSMVHYAGTKDRRAKTTQKFCVKKREPSQILKASNRISYLQIGNFEFKDKVLKLGDLKGNRFRIALRHVDGDNEKIKECLNSLKNSGFINYFGLQRFGNCESIPTYKIGIALLKGDYKEACELILKPREGDMYALKHAREVWWKNRNSAEAASMIHSNKFIEKKLLDGLARFGEHDYANSLRRIPRNMLLLYTHSFQSFIWNKIASRRIKNFGLKLIPGDLVYRDEADKEDASVLDVLDVETMIEMSEEESMQKDEKEETEIQEEISAYKAKVRPLTADDIASKKYSIFDVVLPLPGHDITYPSNEVEQWYEETLEEYGLSSEKLKNNVKTYSLAGAYRKVIIKPENINWEFKRYNSPTSTLISSDYEDLKQAKVLDDCPDGKFQALLIDFILPASSYATMALREILKSDTSVSNQSKLNENEMRRTESLNNDEKDQGEELLKTDSKLNGDENNAQVCDLDKNDDQNNVNQDEGALKRKSEETVETDIKKQKIE